MEWVTVNWYCQLVALLVLEQWQTSCIVLKSDWNALWKLLLYQQANMSTPARKNRQALLKLWWPRGILSCLGKQAANFEPAACILLSKDLPPIGHTTGITSIGRMHASGLMLEQNSILSYVARLPVHNMQHSLMCHNQCYSCVSHIMNQGLGLQGDRASLICCNWLLHGLD